MGLVGVEDCPTCELPFDMRAPAGGKIRLQCEHGHVWLVTNPHNAERFHPDIAA